MKEKKPPFVPTRMCPHRWCKPLHFAPIPFALAVVAFDLWNNWLRLFSLIGAGITMYYINKLVYYKRRPRSGPTTFREVVEDFKESPMPLDLEMEDAKYAGTGWRMLEVHEGWARVSVGCDIFWLLFVGLSCTSMFVAPAAAASHAKDNSFTWSSVIVFFVVLAMVAFSVYAHKKATQPRKPKRAWVPAFMRTNV